MDATATIAEDKSRSVPIARSRTATSECSSSGVTSGGLSNAGSSSSSISTTAVLRRDAARVLSGLFDANGAAAFPNVAGGVRQESNIPSRDSNTTETTFDTNMNQPRRSKRAPVVTPAVNDPSNNTTGHPADDSGVLSAYYMPFPRSSFSYAPRSDDYSSPEPEFDYAAAYAWVHTPESATEDGDNTREGDDEDGYSSSRPPTPPIDFLGMGTPIVNPKLVAKVLKAIADGQPLKLSNGMNGTSGKGKGGMAGKGKAKKKERDAKRSKDGGDASLGKKKDKKSVLGGSKSASAVQDISNKEQQRARASSNAPSAASSSRPTGPPGARNSATAVSSASLAKRARSSTSDGLDEPSKKKHRSGSTATTSTTPATSVSKPRQKCRKGWKGWVEIEVTTSEDEDEEDGSGARGAGATSYDGSSARKSKERADGEEDDGSDAEDVKGRKGWKGWAITEAPLDTSRLIRLDAAPSVLTTRSTRSGRTFGDDPDWEKTLASASVSSSASILNEKRPPAGNRRKSAGVASVVSAQS